MYCSENSREWAISLFATPDARMDYSVGFYTVKNKGASYEKCCKYEVTSRKPYSKANLPNIHISYLYCLQFISYFSDVEVIDRRALVHYLQCTYKILST
jgi:hypothetical protein